MNILQQHADDPWQLRNGLDRLAQPVLDLALPEEKATLVRDPVFRQLPRKLAMPFADLAITAGAYCGGVPDPGRPIIAKCGVLDATTVAAAEE